jgi:hypothetical protein
MLFGLASQTAILAAFLFYLGRARTQAISAYFGIDNSLLGLTPADYILRSVNAALRPLIMLGILALVAMYIHERLLALDPRGWTGQLPIILISFGIAGGAIGLCLAEFQPVTPLGPGVLVLGAGAGGYGLYLRALHVSHDQSTAPYGHPTPAFIVIMALAAAAALWATAAYANWIGIQKAHQIERRLSESSEVIVYSDKDLALTGPGITKTVLPASAPPARYAIRYNGLRLLLRSNDRLFLLPVNWRPRSGSAIILPDKPEGASIRVEFRRGK